MTPVHAMLAAGGPVIPTFGKSSSCVQHNGALCFDWIRDNWDSTFQPALISHLKLTAIAVGIGFVLALGLALLAHQRRWLITPLTLVFATVFTIPSLALFQVLVPISGLTVLTAEIALVGYTLSILFANIITGLREVPAEVRDAARGMGLSDRQILFRVELPIALPAVMAGLRIATVTVISLATIATVITVQSLGGPIFEGIQNDFKTKYVAAGLLTVVLALVADGLLVITQRRLTPWSRARRN